MNAPQNRSPDETKWNPGTVVSQPRSPDGVSGLVLGVVYLFLGVTDLVAAIVLVKELLANPSPEQRVDGEMSRTEKQAGEQAGNGYDAHA